jgi:hypothetical protein
VTDDLRHRLARVCLDATPSRDDLRALGGDASRWILYRTMVRGRFVDTLAEGLPRAFAALGRARLEAAVDHWLTHAPPMTRYVRELSIEFARHVERAPAAFDGAPAWSLDALRYDAAVMACHIAPEASLEGVVELDMARPVALSPAQRLVRVDHTVHLDGAPAARARALVVYRARETDAIETLELTPIAADIYEAMGDGARTLTDCVTAALARNDSHAGQVFIESFADLLGDLLDRGVILGSRSASTSSAP